MGKLDAGDKPTAAVSINWNVPTLPQWLAEAAKAPKWLIPGLLREEALVLMSGQKKRAHKTWLAFTTGVALAAGKQFGIWTPSARAPVLICEEEGPRAGTRERLLGICRTLGVNPAELDNLHFAFHHGIKLDTKMWRDKLLAKVKETGAKLLILDAIVYMHRRDENKVHEMQVVVETLQQVRNLGCTVLYLAHTDKMRGTDPKADIDDQVRGTGLLTDAYDQHLALRRYNMNDPVIALTLRDRDHEGQGFNVRWEFDTAGDTVHQAKLTVESPEQSWRDLEKRCSDVLAPKHRYTPRHLRELWSLSVAKTKSMIETLVNSGVLETRDGALYLRNGESSRARASGTPSTVTAASAANGDV